MKTLLKLLIPLIGCTILGYYTWKIITRYPRWTWPAIITSILIGIAIVLVAFIQVFRNRLICFSSFGDVLLCLTPSVLLLFALGFEATTARTAQTGEVPSTDIRFSIVFTVLVGISVLLLMSIIVRSIALNAAFPFLGFVIGLIKALAGLMLGFVIFSGYHSNDKGTQKKHNIFLLAFFTASGIWLAKRLINGEKVRI